MKKAAHFSEDYAGRRLPGYSRRICRTFDVDANKRQSNLLTRLLSYDMRT